MTTTPTRPRPGYLHATQLPDGTYLVRAGCCRPEACAPALGTRCCATVRCDCPIPAQWLQDPRRASRAARRPFPWGRTAAVGGAVSVGLGALGGVAWGVLEAVAWAVENAVLILGFITLLSVPILIGLRPSRRTFSGTFHGRMS